MKVLLVCGRIPVVRLSCRRISGTSREGRMKSQDHGPMPESSPVGLHRVLSPPNVLPQASDRLDVSPELRSDEVRIAVERLNLDAASFRQLTTKHGGDGDAV